MPYALPLPPHWSAQGWKVKIYDNERLEPPHVTILFRDLHWRFDLRDRRYLDRDPDPADIPAAIEDAVMSNVDLLSAEWNRMHPDNPV